MTEKQEETTKPEKQGPSESRLPSRVPLPSSTRRPSTTQPTLKAVQDHQSKSWGSITSSSRSHTQTKSESTFSSRSYDGYSRLGQPVLRRKKSPLSRENGSLRINLSNLSSPPQKRQSRAMMGSASGIPYYREITESPCDEKSAEVQKSTTQSPIIYPELDRYRSYDRPQNNFSRQFADVPFRLETYDLPPPTPDSLFFSANSSHISAISCSPSTKWSESPGPWSYSRSTTPTSISSQSPRLSAPSRVFSRKARQYSPSLARPPVTRRRTGSISNEVDSISVDPHGLAPVRESLTSSSLNSTVQDGDRNLNDGRKMGKVLASSPLSLPPRKSFEKFRTNKTDDKFSPKPRRHTEIQVSSENSSQNKSASQPQSRQLSLLKIIHPSRPSRNGTPDLKSQLLDPVPIRRSNLVSRSAHIERHGYEPASLDALPLPISQATKDASTSNILLGKYAVLSDGLTSGASKPNTGSSFNTRFPFFGRKKTVAEGAHNGKMDEKKLARKGPTAGTGHEGYGPFGTVRRRSGNVANPPFFPETQFSQGGSVSGDSFLADRINPVIIVGGEVVVNSNASLELRKTERNQSQALNSRPSTGTNMNSLWLSPIPLGPNTAPKARRPADSSDFNSPAIKSTIALRRSIQRLNTSPDNPLRLTQPINTSGMASSPIASFDTTMMSDGSSLFDLWPQISHEPSIIQSAPRKLKKRAWPSLEWNLFGQSQSQPIFSKKAEKVAVTVRPVEKKPVAFYAIMDSPEQKGSDPMDLREALRNANVYTNLRSKVSTSKAQLLESQTPDKSQLSVIALTRLSQTVQRDDNATTEQCVVQSEALLPPHVSLSSSRPSRLPRIGRIPQVVSKLQDKGSRSFSRPFGAISQPFVREPNAQAFDFSVKVSSTIRASTHVSDLDVEDLDVEGLTTDCATEFPLCSELVLHGSPIPPAVNEVTPFSPRKNSGCTTGSSESSTCNLAGATAVIPKPDDPPAEDEVWDEYNDLLGEDIVRSPRSAPLSKAVSFHAENYQMKLTKGKPVNADSRKLSTLSEAPTTSTPFSADMTDRLRANFQPHPNLAASLSVPDAMAQSNKLDWGNLKISGARHSMSSSHNARQSGSSSSSEEGSPLAQVNLRVGSMTVSKWLTFGHVLFSDIRHELVRGMNSLTQPSVLVIDGLGNDDWSFYAAETYPAANFFNLSPRAPLLTDPQSSASGYPISPPNHHQILHLSHLDKFPIAPQSFAAVVYRFPARDPESCYRNIISEARRVLKPGGYIEMSILDVDLNNMGNRGRRTVRQLKERIHEKSPETYSASVSDLMVRLLGRRGFSTVKAARVGVPVTSSVRRVNSDRIGQNSVERKTKAKDRSSLAEMMRDNSPMADEGITNMAARVGRWWYTRCYENPVSSPTEKSIWDNKALLQECEELGTSLKLMVCCARVPERINSV